jgi:hypothetical protein
LSISILQARFLSILPRIELHGRVSFRHVPCPGRRADAIAEMVALAWAWHLRLAERGKDSTRFPGALAVYAARAVRAGRQLCGQERARDVLSPSAQRQHCFVVERLPDFTTLGSNPLTEALSDNPQTPPPEQAAFRLDFPAWLRTRSKRDRRLAEDLMTGERTLDVSTKFGLSPARISQLRREFHEDWERFCGQGEDLAATAVCARPDLSPPMERRVPCDCSAR